MNKIKEDICEVCGERDNAPSKHIHILADSLSTARSPNQKRIKTKVSRAEELSWDFDRWLMRLPSPIIFGSVVICGLIVMSIIFWIFE